MNRQYESMTLVTVGRYTVRVWRTESDFTMGPSAGVLRAMRKARKDPAGIVAALGRVKHVAAFEILKDGQGGLCYPDWY